MNVSFSTRGWQQIPWEQQVQMAETSASAASSSITSTKRRS